MWRVRVCFDLPLKCHVHSKLLLDNCNFHIIKDERLMSKVEVFRGACRLSRTVVVEYLEIIDMECNLKQFDGLT